MTYRICISRVGISALAPQTEIGVTSQAGDFRSRLASFRAVVAVPSAFASSSDKCGRLAISMTLA